MSSYSNNHTTSKVMTAQLQTMKQLSKITAKIILSTATIAILSMNALANDFKKWAETPPMGWNSWDCYGPTVTESEVRNNADYMAENLKDYGWEYVVVDIRWYVENDKAGGYIT